MAGVPSELTSPVFLGLLIVILGFIFFMYLLARRTLLGLREGYEKGRRD